MLRLSSPKHWVVGDFLEHWKGGTGVLVLLGQDIFFGSLSLIQVLLSHPSTSDLRPTINRSLLAGRICLCQITGWFLIEREGDFGENQRHRLFL